MLKITGIVALLATLALAPALTLALRPDRFSGRIDWAQDRTIRIVPDEATLRYYWGGKPLPSTLETSWRIGKLDSLVLEVCVPYEVFDEVRFGDQVTVEHRGLALPGTGWGIGRTRLTLPRKDWREPMWPVYLACAGASAAPLGLWGLTALIAVLATPRRQGIMKPA